MSSILVAMSGGVDSSTVAALSKLKHDKVVGVTFKMFDAASTEKAVADAKSVANMLGIEHRVADCSEIFKKHVIDYFVEAYQKGETPNPCVMCNPFVKFHVLYKLKQKWGLDFIATGHYARLEKNGNEILLRKAADLTKDQSYFLYRVPKGIFQVTEFPLGDFTKTHTRELARQFGLPVAEKSESQDICFIQNCKYSDFVCCHRKCGNIVDETGNVLGKHNGVENYTIGQRKGLHLSGGPYFVTKINSLTNEVIVSKNPPVGTKIILQNVVWLNEEKFGKCKAKIRSSKPEKSATVEAVNGNVQVIFDEQEIGIAPGQHCVFYSDDQVIGGGIISNG